MTEPKGTVERKLGPDGVFVSPELQPKPMPAFMRELGQQRKSYDQLLKETLAKASDEPVKRAPLDKKVIADLVAHRAAKPKPEEEPKEPEHEEHEREQAKPKAEPKVKTEAPQPQPPLIKLFLPGIAGDLQAYYLNTSMQPSHIISLSVGLWCLPLSPAPT
jgi:hypothetical protein